MTQSELHHLKMYRRCRLEVLTLSEDSKENIIFSFERNWSDCTLAHFRSNVVSLPDSKRDNGQRRIFAGPRREL